MTIPVEQLHDMLKYNPDTGEFIWRERAEDFPSPLSAIRSFNSRCAGKLVYQEGHKGYRRIKLLSKRYKSHRLAWAIHHGDWPKDQIDHINGVRSDNRIDNLREASQTDNARNTRIPATNMSGVIGIRWNKIIFRWVATIGVNNVNVHLGSFKDFEEAVSVRRSAEVKYGYHPNHGKR
tara:strand:- start:270 stop:803 length:534 start_codon:yes stop_codon:yes gene_type:complete